MKNLSAVCLTEAQMQMHGTELEKYLQRYFFPVLAVFGILGNLLNLTVLLNRRMRSRANTFLALLAFSDIIFLSLLLPNVLANYPLFTYNYYFRLFYFHTKTTLLAFANWWSAVAIWCVIAVCADRLIGIRHPLYIRSHIASYKMSLLLCAIVAIPGLFTFYQHFAYKCIIRSFCSGTQLYSMCLPVNQDRWIGNQSNPYSESFREFIDVSIRLNAICVIIFPIILLAALNMLLLCALRQRTTGLLMNEETTSQSKPCIDSLKHQKTENRVTLTVTLIVTLFTITNGPSAIVHLLQTVYQFQHKKWYNIVLICSAMVVVGKASNFILFCLCSKHFRSRLFSLAQRKVHERLQASIGHNRPSCNERRTSVPSRKDTGSTKISICQRTNDVSPPF